MNVLLVRTELHPCESCGVVPSHRGVVVSEVHFVGTNQHVFPEMILCDACLKGYTDSLSAILRDDPR